MSASPGPIVVCGGGLAGNLAALSLARSLGEAFQIIQITAPANADDDMFYGGVTAPDSYNFLRGLGLDEPTLLLKGRASFSFGTHFRSWQGSRSWMQCHHTPFPVTAGVPLRHYLIRAGAPLETVLISAQAALQGRFAHPPRDPRSPLSRAEYGFQFAPADLTALVEAELADSRVQRIAADISGFEMGDGRITAVRLNSGETVSGALFVDATGQARRCVMAAGAGFQSRRTVAMSYDMKAADQLGPPCRIVEATAAGWRSTSHLQGGALTMRFSADDDEASSAPHSRMELGHLDRAWVDNCVAIGHAACVLEPLTPAPMMMLQRDIERLKELIPAGGEMATERREFNRRFADDVSHFNMFHDALHLCEDAPDAPYWREARSAAGCEALTRKITRFESRGLLVRYDLEPFNEEDWTLVHLGMGRRPRRHDRQLDGVSVQEAGRYLMQLRQAIEHTVAKMPPHHVYMAGFTDYLKKQRHV